MFATFQVDTIIVALIAALIAPSVLAIGNARISARNQDKLWAREDELETRRIAREEERYSRMQESLSSITLEAKTIHALVNSELTKAYERDLGSVIVARDALAKVIELTKQLGEEPSEEDLKALSAKDYRINMLERIIQERKKHQEKLDYLASGEKTKEDSNEN
jgi:hypothetical protein